MTSSYKSTLDYSDVIKAITSVVHPSKIVEFGILEGFSLMTFADTIHCSIDAYDIFDDFNGNHAQKNIIDKFKDYKHVKIEYGNFYDKLLTIPYNSVDILHIDIANCGDVYEYAVKYGLDRITPNGIMLLEGGSKERDNVYWMKKYNKKPIAPFLDELKKTSSLHITVLEKFPSMTIIKT
jgi:hypothetical protein